MMEIFKSDPCKHINREKSVKNTGCLFTTTNICP
uniref:Histonelysine Nmethyltransferase SETMARlike [Ceratitis capitata] n=1 Tax=Lepeophtheirus salmonis TaxID=72036 RepID=A0A0K2TT21_LEPSM